MGSPFYSRIKEKSSSTPVVVAIDSPVEAAVERVIEALGSERRPPPLKVGWIPLLRDGASALAKVKRAAPSSELIADIKIADVPHVGRAVAGELFRAGADAVIVHGFLGRDAVEGVMEAAREHGGGVLVVAETSNPGALDCYQGCALSIIRAALELGADGIIAPATRPRRISEFRRIMGPGPLILSPGVGPQGGDALEALEMGADMVIVGRSVMEAPDPLAEFRRIRDLLARGAGSR